MSELPSKKAEQQLPDLHRQAFLIKNRKRFQHDGGRAWIKDGQLHDAVKGVNCRIELGIPLSDRLKKTGHRMLENLAGELIYKTNSFKKI
ncbi:MAG: hypothetical protein WD097_08960 [Balneolales bacterium]